MNSNYEINIVDYIDEVIKEYKKTKDSTLITSFLTSFSKEMALIHYNGQFIGFEDFDKNKIVNGRIIFDKVYNMPIDAKSFYISKNLERFAALAIGLYLDIDHSKVLHEESIKESDPKIWQSYIDPQRDKDYYTAVLNNERQETFYYHDYLTMLKREESKNVGNSQSKNRVLVKSLPNMVVHEDESEHQMAFMQTAYLTITLALFGLMMIALAFVIVYK